MKGIFLSAVASILGFICIIGIYSVFEYSAVYRHSSFALRNALYQSGREALIPLETCEWALCENLEHSEQGDCIVCEDGFVEECKEEFMDEHMFFNVLCDYMKQYKQLRQRWEVELMQYETEPFLARVVLQVKVYSMFWNAMIQHDELVLANEK